MWNWRATTPTKPHVGQHYALWMEEQGLANWRDYFLQPTGHVQAQRRKWLIPERYHYNAWIAERSNSLLSQYHDAGEPFFLWASFFDPHPKYLVPEPWGHHVRPAVDHCAASQARRA